jgi:type IV pilus assembly protein PilB
MRLGEMLVKAGNIDEFQLNSALSYQRHWGGQIGSSLVKLGYIGEDDLLRFLSEQLNLTRIDLSRISISPAVLESVPVEKALEYNIIPVDRKEMNGTIYLLIAMSNPTNLIIIDALQFATGCRVRPALASHDSIRAAIERCYSSLPARVKTLDDPPAEVKPVSDIDPFQFPPVKLDNDTHMTIDVKFELLIKVLMEKGLLSISDFERLK